MEETDRECKASIPEVFLARARRRGAEILFEPQWGDMLYLNSDEDCILNSR